MPVADSGLQTVTKMWLINRNNNLKSKENLTVIAELLKKIHKTVSNSHVG